MKLGEILFRHGPTNTKIPLESKEEGTTRIQRECEEYLNDPQKNGIEDFQSFVKNIINLHLDPTTGTVSHGNITLLRATIDGKDGTAIFMLQKEMKGIKEKIGGEKISDASSTVIKLFTSNGQEETLKIETVRDWPTTITLTQQNKTRQIEIDSWTMGKQQLTLNSPSKDFDSSAPETHVLLKQLAKKIFTISQSNLLAGEEPMFTGPDGKSYPSMDMVRAAKAELNPKKEKPRR